MEVKKLQIPKSSEEVLLETGKFAILAIQLNAYLPFSVVRGKLCFKYFTVSFILQVLFYIAFIFSWMFFAFHATDFTRAHEIYTSTERVFFDVLTITNTILIFYCRLYSFCCRKPTLEFWKSNVKLLDRFLSYPTEKSQRMSNSSDCDKTLRKTFTSVRTSFAATLVLILAIHLCVYCVQPKDMSTLLLVSQHFIMLAQWSHVGQGIWLCFFLKFYSALFRTIESRLRSLVEPGICSEGVELIQKVGEGRFEMELNECYKLYIKVYNQVKEFSDYFQKRLIAECFLSFVNIISSTFLFLRWVMELQNKIKIVASVNLLLQVALFGKILHDLGTEGNRLSRSAAGVMDQLHDIYSTCGHKLSFRIRQTLEMFAVRINTNPPVIDAAQYFTIDRNFVSTVNTV